MIIYRITQCIFHDCVIYLAFNKEKFMYNMLDIFKDFDFDTFNKFNTIGSSSSVSYPPYNIIKLSDQKIILDLAVAGLNKDDFEIMVVKNKLLINHTPRDVPEHKYMYRGIAKRSFKLKYMLDDLEVKSVELDSGILRVILEKNVPETEKPRLLEIKTK